MSIQRWKFHQLYSFGTTSFLNKKCKYILVRKYHPTERCPPLFLYVIFVLSTYLPLKPIIFSWTERAKPSNHEKLNTYKMCFNSGYNFQFGYKFHAGIGFYGSWNTKQHLKSLCHLAAFLPKSLCRKYIPCTWSALLGLNFVSILGDGFRPFQYYR